MALTKINASVIANNTIAVGNIADNSVDATKIASNSILTRHIDDDQITTDQIAANTIATANIADNAVDGTKIASNSILTRHIDDNQIGIDQLNVSDGSNGQALTTNGSGTLAFSTISSTPTSIADADSDTKIQVEESSDEDVIRFDVGGTEYMTLTSNGKLNVTEIAHISSGSLEIGNGDEKQIFDASGATIQFQTADTERMRIDGSGNIGIGQTPTTNSRLWVTGLTGKYATYLTFPSGGYGMGMNTSSGTSNTFHYYFNQGTFVGQVYTNGSATIWASASDYRLKENVVTDWDATTRLKQLKPSRFNFIKDSSNTLQDGFLAHEVQDIVPEAIVGVKDEVDENGDAKYQSIDQSKLVPLLTKALQEQQTIIEDLKSRIETLEG